jgi:hypothetical protein
LPSALPIEAREAAGRALWARLLSDPSQDPEPENDEPESNEERPDEAA